MKKRSSQHFASILLGILSFPSFLMADAVPSNTRLSDDLNKTGERIAVVIKNNAEQSIPVRIFGEPDFYLLDGGVNKGIINAPRKNISYKVYYRRYLGMPRLMQERAEDLNDFDGLRPAKEMFSTLEGMRLNSGVYAQMAANYNTRCTTVLPDIEAMKNDPVLKKLDFSKQGPNLTIGVIYIKIDANARKCTAKFKIPGDVSWIDQGPEEPGTSANLDGAMEVSARAKKWIDDLIENQSAVNYKPVVLNGSFDGALAVRDQASQLLSQRTSPVSSDFGKKIEWAVANDDNSLGYTTLNWATGNDTQQQ